jgi:hypothetical protein
VGQVNFTVYIRAMDDVVRETIVASFSRIVMQRCDDRLVDCAVEHKVRELKRFNGRLATTFLSVYVAAKLLTVLRWFMCMSICSTRPRPRRATRS